jgi:hypothetical protein
MPVIRIGEGCPETREAHEPGKPGSIGQKICGRPIYMNGVCDQCYRCNEQLREGGYVPFQPTGGVSERLGRDAYERLYVEDDTLRKKGIERDVQTLMVNFDAEAADLLG